MVDFKALIAERREKFNIENRPQNKVSISIAGPDYAISFGFDRPLLDKLRQAIPQSEITWHKARKVWLVHPDEVNKAVEVITSHTGQVITLPEAKPITPETIEKSFLLEYLGATKDRGKKTSAYGFVNDAWSVEITEEVLRGFFEGRESNTKPDGIQTLYQVLCVVESVEPEQIRKAYKRLALHNHPDTSKEPDAQERFIKINEAYKILIDPEQRRRYDAGLYFERQSKTPQEPVYGQRLSYGYRSPLRCGQITAKGTVRLMRFIVSEIIKWDDVVDSQGRVMTSSWPKGSDTFVTEWLNQSPF